MIPSEPVQGRYAYLEIPGLLGLSGLEQMRPFIKRLIPYPPLFQLSGMRPVEAAPGTSTWSMPATGWWRSGAGPFLPGAYVFAADAAFGTAIWTTMPRSMILATSEISMSFLRPATPASGSLIARSRLVQVGRSQGLSEATVEDAHGRVLAHGTSRLVISPLPFDPPPPPEEYPPLEEVYQTRAPFQREPEGVVQPQEVWDSMSGLEVMQRWIKGELPVPPCGHLLGWRAIDVEEGRATGAMAASAWFTTSLRSFYGGALAVLADATLNAAMTTTLAPGDSYGTLDFKMHFLRPVEPDGRELTATAEIQHRGRRLIVATATIEDADGRRVAMATESALVFSGRPWMPQEPFSTMDEIATDD